MRVDMTIKSCTCPRLTKKELASRAASQCALSRPKAYCLQAILPALKKTPQNRRRICTPSRAESANSYSIAAEWTRRSMLKLLAASPLVAEQASSETQEGASAEENRSVDTTVTAQVFLDIGLCQNGTQQTRGLGDKAYCTNPDSLGRVVIGLYGNQVPATVQNFLALVRQGVYNSTVFNKILPGEYITAGKQFEWCEGLIKIQDRKSRQMGRHSPMGPSRMGEVALNMPLPSNRDLMTSKSYDLDHRRAGTVSVNLSHNDDDSLYQQSSSYRNVSFLITTGPGPATSLDGTNVVFGRVLQGMDTVAKVAGVPTFKPVNDRMLAFNKLGSMLGDERAGKTRKKWGKPLKPVLITNSGILS